LHAKLLRNRILWSLQGVLYFPPRILIVQIEHPTLGMFAHLRWCLDFMCLCEEHGLEPYFILASPQYRDPQRGPNWFDYFFVHAHLSEEDRKVVGERIARGQVRRIRWSDDILYRAYDDELTLQDAHCLLQKYIRIQPWVQEKVDRFARRELDGRHVLGVHYRGTDRGFEAPKASYDSMADLVRRYLEHVPATDAVFVATDESALSSTCRRASAASRWCATRRPRSRTTTRPSTRWPAVIPICGARRRSSTVSSSRDAAT
jgi:hypothetical protein